MVAEDNGEREVGGGLSGCGGSQRGREVFGACMVVGAAMGQGKVWGLSGSAACLEGGLRIDVCSCGLTI